MGSQQGTLNDRLAVVGKEEIDNIYAALDTDNNGHVTADELCEWIEKEKYFESKNAYIEARAMLHEMDTNGDGNIDRNELKHYFQEKIPKKRRETLTKHLSMRLVEKRKREKCVKQLIDVMEANGGFRREEVLLKLRQTDEDLVQREKLDRRTTSSSSLPQITKASSTVTSSTLTTRPTQLSISKSDVTTSITTRRKAKFEFKFDTDGKISAKTLYEGIEEWPLSVLENLVESFRLSLLSYFSLHARNQHKVEVSFKIPSPVLIKQTIEIGWGYVESSSWQDGDWIGLFSVGSPHKPGGAKARKSVPKELASTCVAQFDIPEVNGSFEFRYYRLDYDVGAIGVSPPISLGDSVESEPSSPTHSRSRRGSFSFPSHSPTSQTTPTTPTTPTPQLDKLQKTLEEILVSEEKYVQSLTDFLVRLINPLKLHAAELNVSDSQIKEIFGNVEAIITLHIEILKELKRNSSDPGSVYAKYADFLKMYTQYCNGYEKGIATINSLRNNNELNKFLDECRVKLQGLGLMDFLIMPVQRIPRYVLLFRDLKSRTPIDAPEQKTIKSTLEKMEEICTRVNETKRRYEDASTLLAIQHRLGNVEIFTPSRVLLRQGSVQDVSIVDDLSLGVAPSFLTTAIDLLLFNDKIIWIPANRTTIGGTVQLRDLLFGTSFGNRQGLFPPFTIILKQKEHALKKDSQNAGLVLVVGEEKSYELWLTDIKKALTQSASSFLLPDLRTPTNSAPPSPLKSSSSTTFVPPPLQRST